LRRLALFSGGGFRSFKRAANDIAPKRLVLGFVKERIKEFTAISFFGGSRCGGVNLLVGWHGFYPVVERRWS